MNMKNKTKQNKILIFIILTIIIFAVVGIVIFRQNIVTEENRGNIGKGQVSEIAENSNKSGISLDNINMGSYIDYNVPNTNSYTANADQTGLDQDRTYTASSLKWRVLSKNAENNTIEIISTKEDENNFSLKGFKGYNNGVKLLNDACNSLYVNSEKGGISARNLKIEDIEAHYKEGERKASQREFTLANKYYPEIFSSEVNGSIAKSNQSEFVSQTNAKSGSINGKITFYGFTMSTHRMDNKENVDLFSCTEGKMQWLASRCIDYANDKAYFALNYVTGSYIGNGILYNSENKLETYECSLRPIVTIDLSKVVIGNGGSGTENDPYSVEEPERPPLTIDEMEVGKYVAYNPFQELEGTPNKFTSPKIYSGYARDMTYEQGTTLKWRILSKTEDEIQLISDKEDTNPFYLGGYQGYNNGVALLNNACKAMYSNSSLGAKARSLNMDDIEKYHTGSEAPTYEEHTPSNKYYPAIFEVERWGSIDGNYKGSIEKSQMPTSGLEGELQEDGYILQNSTKQASTLKGKNTYYNFEMSSSNMRDQVYVDLFKITSIRQWLASRCVGFYSSYANFLVFYVDSSSVNARNLYYSSGSVYAVGCAVRPVIILNPKSIAIRKLWLWNGRRPI